MMSRLCERPACSEPGVIAYGFDAERLLVWLVPLDPDADRNRAGVLCLRHADAMVVPIGWTLDDSREPSPQLFRPPGGSRAPRTSRSRRRKASTPAASETTEQLPLPEAAERTVAAVTGVAAAVQDDPDATVAIPWRPEFDDDDDLGGALEATSPLLRRAFRGTARH